MKKKLMLIGATLIIAIALSGCGKSADTDNASNAGQSGGSMSNTNMGDMEHSSSGEVPAALKEAKEPAFMVGSQATIKASHMSGMDGAKATVVGAYSTTAYTVSYIPTTGGPKVTNHKWVIHEELKNPGAAPYKPGDKVVLQADHMKGMNGANGTIDSAEQTTVYMVDYIPTTGVEKVENHKWVTESELAGGDMTGMKH